MRHTYLTFNLNLLTANENSRLKQWSVFFTDAYKHLIILALFWGIGQEESFAAMARTPLFSMLIYQRLA